LWLFNPELKFNKRKGFNIEDDINSQDYIQMRKCNRKTLTQFFKNLQVGSPQKKSYIGMIP
jgi:hypothetical protein